MRRWLVGSFLFLFSSVSHSLHCSFALFERSQPTNLLHSSYGYNGLSVGLVHIGPQILIRYTGYLVLNVFVFKVFYSTNNIRCPTTDTFTGSAILCPYRTRERGCGESRFTAAIIERSSTILVTQMSRVTTLVTPMEHSVKIGLSFLALRTVPTVQQTNRYRRILDDLKQYPKRFR